MECQVRARARDPRRSSQSLLAQVFVANDASNDHDTTAWLSPLLMHRLGLREGDAVDLEATETFQHSQPRTSNSNADRPPCPAAESVVLQRIMAPNHDLLMPFPPTSIIDQLQMASIRDFFLATPRVVAVDDVLAIPVRTSRFYPIERHLADEASDAPKHTSDTEPEQLPFKSYSNGHDEHEQLMYFCVARCEVANADEGSHEVQTDVFVDTTVTQLLRQGSVQMGLPPFFQSFHSWRSGDHRSAARRWIEHTELFQQLHTALQPFTLAASRPFVSRLKGGVLVHGQRQSGKRSTIYRVADALGVHVIEVLPHIALTIESARLTRCHSDQLPRHHHANREQDCSVPYVLASTSLPTPTHSMSCCIDSSRVHQRSDECDSLHSTSETLWGAVQDRRRDATHPREPRVPHIDCTATRPRWRSQTATIRAATASSPRRHSRESRQPIGSSTLGMFLSRAREQGARPRVASRDPRGSV